MPKINELTRAQTLAATDLFAAENTSGTSTRGVSAQQIKDFATADVNAEVTDLKNALGEYTYNLLDVNVLKNGNVTVSNGVASGTAIAFTNAFGSSVGVPAGITFGTNKQYTISGKAKNLGETTTGNGLSVRAKYTDDTFSYAIFLNTWTTPTDFVLTTTEGKTVSKIYFDYSSAGQNTWEISEFMIEEGGVKHDYIPYLSAADYIARNNINSLQSDFDNAEDRIDGIVGIQKKYFIPLVFTYGTINSSGKNANDSANMRTTEIIHVAKGSKIVKKNSSISLMAFFYDDYNVNNYDSSAQIIPAASTEYTFASDAFVRFVIQNPSSLAHSPAWAAEVIESMIVDADGEYKKIGLEIGVLGYSAYLGNAILFRFPNGKILMIDSFIAAAQTALINDMVPFGATHLDYFMITHYHKDHVGNVEYLIDHGYIDENTTVFLPQDLDTSYASNIFFDWNDEDGPKAMYEAVKPALVASGATLKYPTEGETLCIAGITLKWWNCDHSVYYPGGAYASQNFNDLTMGVYLTVGNYNFCDTGDLGPKGQERMVALNTMMKANLYTAEHHGWDNGNADNYYGLLPAWINRLSPDVVISEDYSAHNTHIMTKSSPMQSWCEASGVPNYRTAVNGTMFFRLNEFGWKLLGPYSRFIRNGKNWSYSDNSEHIET